jgi:hypothetical protein
MEILLDLAATQCTAEVVGDELKTQEAESWRE